METAVDYKTIGATILQQLGGQKFVMMTGCSKFMIGEKSETNPKYWLRMNIGQNSKGVNRLKVYYNEVTDDYTMEFYRQVMDHKTFDVKISRVKIYENVFCDQLQELFTEATGLYTHL